VLTCRNEIVMQMAAASATRPGSTVVTRGRRASSAKYPDAESPLLEAERDAHVSADVLSATAVNFDTTEDLAIDDRLFHTSSYMSTPPHQSPSTVPACRQG